MPIKRPSPPVLLACVLVLGLALWLALGDLQRFRSEPPDEKTDERPEALTRVEVVNSQAEIYTPHLITQGQLAADKEVELRAREAGVVESLTVAEGDEVDAGDELLQLDQEDLPAQLDRARAELESAQAELDGAERLRERDLISRNEQLNLAAALAQAVAEVASLEQSLEHTRPKAPFTGTVDRLDVETGDLLQVGETYALLIDNRNLEAQAHVAQRDVMPLEPGLPVVVTLLDGTELEGELSHVASRAEESTRSFAVEARLDNPDRRRVAGASATLSIELPQRQAHAISPALLALDDEGRLGVKAVDDNDRVVFRPVTRLATNSDRAWVAGLPDQVRLITLGAGLVEAGERVDPETLEDTPATADDLDTVSANDRDS
ncbi:efflux RND transporter periplasmic adaptor subunit [Aidingimonas halophila]|uniref:Membrane fusion protein, multidrug efflux system n=1 Tax=Aidingimonas halophila TaxID=574349 RepID=A0A1H2RUI2_9GAMM|nr:efflux RND transporter periplasmic adaptor subunit [Aidingimonas halophila]GHC18678.1 hemolysin D [Aidingimonas halophila]SDW23091.1 membrane fusion protein, multidrug efflux system [Aidingimonas halophila]